MRRVGHQSGKYREMNHLKTSKHHSAVCATLCSFSHVKPGRGPATRPFLFPKDPSHYQPEMQSEGDKHKGVQGLTESRS